LIVPIFLVLLFASPKPALASSGCGSSYVVQWGDTLGSVAAACGTSVDALRQANPNVGYWIYAGQTLSVPGGYHQGGYVHGYQGASDCHPGMSDCYGYQYGSNCYSYQDSGFHYGGQWSENCYGTQHGGYGHAAYAPPKTTGRTYVVRRGETMRIIANRIGVPLWDLVAANPQIRNPNMIYAGQVICLPSYTGQSTYQHAGQYWGQAGYHGDKHDGHKGYHKKPTNLYTIERRETLKDIARKFDTTQEALLDLNPSLLGKPGRIHPGLVIRVY
jgi:LysM repeat protein